ncbi:MAG: hypothetical protein QXH47_02655 [Candidatus Bathyarchaeia archaeon]
MVSEIVLENKYLKWVIDKKGFSKLFLDKTSGQNYLDFTLQNPFTELVKNGRGYWPSSIELNNDELKIIFDEIKIECCLKIRIEEDYIVFEPHSINDQNVEEFTLCKIPLTIKENIGRLLNIGYNDIFAACILALNLQVRSYGASDEKAILVAKCYPRYGLLKSKIAIVGVPFNKIKETIRRIQLREGLPSPTLAGVWDKASPEVKKSYLFIDVTEQNVDEVIEYAKKGGFSYVMMYDSSWSTSCGSYPINLRNYPNGLESLKKVVKKMHDAGLKVGLHFLTTCISKNDPYVTPVPDKRLLKNARFTLADTIDENSSFIPTSGPPKDVPIKPQLYYAGGGNEIQIDNEIIIYSGVSLQPPYGFTGCIRGARGTKPAEHKKGATVYHLAEMFGFYIADAESTLLDEIAQRIANIVNECGFDMIYFDGAEAASAQGAWWYYIPKVQLAFFNKFRREVLIQGASYTVSIYRGQGTMLKPTDEQLDHFNWHIYSRDAQTDRAYRGVKGHVDKVKIPGVIKVQANLMPAEFGWFGVYTKTPYYPATQPDEVEYVCNKCLGYDSPLSIETTVHDLRENGWTPEILSIVKNYEELRLRNILSEEERRRLRELGAEFRLIKPSKNRWVLRRVKHFEHYVKGINGVDNEWTIYSDFEEPSFELRIQALSSLAEYDESENILLVNVNELDQFTSSSATGVTYRIEKSTEKIKVGTISGKIVVESSLKDDTGWCQFIRNVNLNLSNNRGIGLWVYGDGKGEILNIQLKNIGFSIDPVCDHYIVINFKGWRYLEIPEPEGERIFDFFKYTEDYYSLAAHIFDYSKVGAINIRLMKLPPKDTVTLYISDIKALKEKLLPLRNPSVTINGKTTTFNVELQPDQYLIFKPEMNTCKLYSANGFVLKDVEVEGEIPIIRKGINRISFNCKLSSDSSQKAKVKISLIEKVGG